MAKKKNYGDDDGRTVADMSGLSRTPLVIPKPFENSAKRKEKEEAAEQKPENQVQLTKNERRSFIMGTLSASILIGLVFAAVFAAVILLIIFFGK